MALFELREYSFAYPGGADALRKCSLTVERSQFWLLCGPSGCGKTTLLRSLKPEISPCGRRSGELRYDGVPLKELSPVRSAREIGFVFQDPENQIVTDTVWHELAFGLENLGLPTPAVRRKVAETALFFGIDQWFDKKVWELSGGEKQLLNLAAVMAMGCGTVVLDEPTAQLDPVAARNFISLLLRIHRELGTTVILSEHRLEELLPSVTHVALMEEGQVAFAGPPREFTRMVTSTPGHRFLPALSAPSRIFAGVGGRGECPLSVAEGRLWLEKILKGVSAPSGTLQGEKHGAPASRKERDTALRVRDLWYRWPGGDFILRGLDLELAAGEIHAVLGGNGSGKTTLLNLLAGVLTPVRGGIKVSGRRKVALLSQAPKAMFRFDTLREELEAPGVKKGEAEELAARLGLAGLLDRHPHDLSGGEQQRAALAKLLLRHPDILLLDEPAKGLDAFAREELRDLLLELRDEGKTILLVTHDAEFAARCADCCTMIFGGQRICTQPSREFFAGNQFFTTDACRMMSAAGFSAVTCQEAVEELSRALQVQGRAQRG